MRPRLLTVLATCAYLLLLGGCSATETPVGADTTTVAVFELSTHCGIDDLVLGDAWYERVEGRLDDGNGNPPSGWANPIQEGRVERLGDRVVFTDSAGHRETFCLRPNATGGKQGCA